MVDKKSILKYLKQYLLKAFHAFESWYWTLNALPRRILGWCLLISVVTITLWTTYKVGHFIYRGGLQTIEWVAEMFGPEPMPDTPEEDADLQQYSYYSGNYKHREFPTGEINKKRNLNYNKVFNHKNDVHLAAAQKLGIPPQPDRAALENHTHKLVKLEDTRYYHVDKMTQSQPYLVPDAADFLTALGRLWQQYHGSHSRFIITSCTRTDADIKKLRRINVNSTKDSAHRYGTTIDITYNRYDTRDRVWDGKLKADLGRALYDMQEAGHCYVKYEYKQACFHITVRPRH